MAFNTCIITGQRGTFRLSQPPPRPVFNRLNIDELTDSWHSDKLDNPTLTPGVAHPLFPGMILEDAVLEEEVPEFPATAEAPDGRLGSYTVECKWRGDLRGTKPTKVINRGMRRTLAAGWDERTRRVISWHCEPKSITGTASTDIFACPAHGFSDGQKVYLYTLTGGSGLVASSLTALGTLYYIINATADAFQLSTSAGGSAVNFTTDLTAGKILAAEFALGAAHPDLPNMFLSDVSIVDDSTDWKTADLTYRGMEAAKPYERTITGNVTTSTSRSDATTAIISTRWQNYPPVDSTTVDSLGVDPGDDLEYDQAGLSITDTYLTTTEPDTEKIGAPWTPPNPPDVAVLTLYGPKYKYFFPFGWKCDAMPIQKIPGRDVWLVSVTWSYRVLSMPVMP